MHFLPVGRQIPDQRAVEVLVVLPEELVMLPQLGAQATPPRHDVGPSRCREGPTTAALEPERTSGEGSSNVAALPLAAWAVAEMLDLAGAKYAIPAAGARMPGPGAVHPVMATSTREVLGARGS